jgi:hypothetical protein
MRRILLTFGGAAYDHAIGQTVERGTKLGADEVYVYDDFWLVHEDKDFREMNAWLWDHVSAIPSSPKGRGFGWYIWKARILFHALERMKDGDVVMYVDGDSCPIDQFGSLFDICKAEGGIMCFGACGHLHHWWTTKDCQLVMGLEGIEGDREHPVHAGVARFILIEKGRWPPFQFLCEWLAYGVNKYATTFEHGRIRSPECEDFHEHRSEQAVLTNLMLKYKIPMHRELDQHNHFDVHPDDRYPVCFQQTHTGGPFHDIGNGSRFRKVMT